MRQALASRYRTALPTASRLTSLVSDPASTAYDLTLGFAYNDAGQIKSRTASNDAYSWNRATNVTDAFTANGLNQMKMGSTFGYDARGNLTASGSDSYSYSSENLLTSGTVDGVTTPLTYDPLLRLYQIGTTGGMKLVYDGTNIIGQSNGTTLGRRYVAVLGSDEVLVEYKVSTGTKDYKLTDERGSVIAVTDASGNGVAIGTYDEYGIPGSSNPGRFQYTGQFFLFELGLQYSKARMYAPGLGRFLQTDPIRYRDGMNWYNYVKADPVNASDPSGQCEITTWEDNKGRSHTTYTGDCGDHTSDPFGLFFILGGEYTIGNPFGAGGEASRTIAYIKDRLTVKRPCGGLAAKAASILYKAGGLTARTGQGVTILAGVIEMADFTPAVPITAPGGAALGAFGLTGVVVGSGAQGVAGAYYAWHGNPYPLFNAVSNLTFGLVPAKNELAKELAGNMLEGSENAIESGASPSCRPEE